MIFTSLAWGSLYRAALERLRDSAARHAVPVDLHVRDGEPPSRGAALRLKPEVILYELLVHDRCVWIDADGVFRKPWDYEWPHEADIVAPIDRGLWGAHVVGFTRSPKALEVLEAWCAEMQDDSWGDNEFLTMNAAIMQRKPVVVELPIRYAWVDSWHRTRYGNVRPVIETNVQLEGCCL